MAIVSQFRVELVRSINTFNPLVWYEKGDKLEPFPTRTVMQKILAIGNEFWFSLEVFAVERRKKYVNFG